MLHKIHLTKLARELSSGLIDRHGPVPTLRIAISDEGVLPKMLHLGSIPVEPKIDVSLRHGRVRFGRIDRRADRAIEAPPLGLRHRSDQWEPLCCFSLAASALASI